MDKKLLIKIVILISFFLLLPGKSEAGIKKIAVIDFDDTVASTQNQNKNPLFLLMAMRGQTPPKLKLKRVKLEGWWLIY